MQGVAISGTIHSDFHYLCDSKPNKLMKVNYIALGLLQVLILACNTTEQGKSPVTKAQTEQASPVFYGETFGSDQVLTAAELSQRFDAMSAQDTLALTFTGKVKEVCQVKGCWMTLDQPDGKEVRITFKDYGFFVPKDLSGKIVEANGIALIQETDVETLRHLAQDGGKSQEEIDAITTPELTYSFIASGVKVLEP